MGLHYLLGNMMANHTACTQLSEAPERGHARIIALTCLHEPLVASSLASPVTPPCHTPRRFNLFNINNAHMVNLRAAITSNDPANPLARQSIGLVEQKLLNAKVCVHVAGRGGRWCVRVGGAHHPCHALPCYATAVGAWLHCAVCMASCSGRLMLVGLMS